MDNYSAIQMPRRGSAERLDLDPDQIRRQEEIDATDAARREAKERGVDLTKLEGTGADGRIIVTDVVEAAEAMKRRGGV